MRTRAKALIGRESELTAVLGRLRGDGPACFLMGEPGVGKSRLIAEVSTRAQADGWIVARGRASSMGTMSPLRPFAEAIAGIQRCGLLPEDTLGGYRPLLTRALPELSGSVQLGPGETPPLVAFAEAVLRLLTALGAPRGGCLLVLEDLHDADPHSIAVLDYLLDNAVGAPIALLGALRDQPSDARELLGAAQRRGVAELLPIRPLDRADTDLLVAACLGGERPVAPLSELAWRNTAGNPLALEELLYHLLEDGQLHQHGGDWQLSPDAAPAPPPSMLQLIESRLGRMNQLARRLAVTAAVYGEQCPLPTIQAALGAVEPDFLDALAAATAAQLLVADRPGWHRFHHPLTYAAVLELASPAERRKAASRLAEAVLAENPELAGPTCRTAARLLAEADQPVRAGELYGRAGRLALQAGAAELAVADLETAIRLLPSVHVRRVYVIDDLVRALVEVCQIDRAHAIVDELDPATDGSDRQLRALTRLYLAWGYVAIARMEQARLHLAWVRARAAGTDTELVRIHCDALEVCLQAFPAGAVAPEIADRARAIAKAAERLADTAVEPHDRREAAEAACRAWGAAALVLERCGYQEAHGCRRRRLALADRFDLPSWQVAGMRDLANQRWLTDGDDTALQAAHDHAQRLGAVDAVLGLKARLAVHQVMVGEGSLDHAVATLTACAEQARRLNYLPGLRWPYSGLVLAAGFRADRPALTKALAQQEASGPTPIGAMTAGTASVVCLMLEGRDSEALTTLAGMAERRLLGSYFLSFPLGLLLLLETVAGTASPEQVTQALATSSQMRWTRQFLHWAAAVHAGRRGDHQAVQRHAKLAAQAAEIYPLTRHLAARVVAPAAVADGWGQPIEDLRAAETWFHEQGIAVAARSCRDLLRSLGVPIQQRREGNDTIPAGLRAAGITVREYEVGLLVGDHLNNRDIAARLHISPRTVENHVAALLHKLMLPDRRALITAMTAAS